MDNLFPVFLSQKKKKNVSICAFSHLSKPALVSHDSTCGFWLRGGQGDKNAGKISRCQVAVLARWGRNDSAADKAMASLSYFAQSYVC